MASQTLIDKLHPRRFPGMSNKMAAIVGCVLGVEYTNPAIAEIVVTSDQCVLARHTNDCGHNDFIGHFSDLKNNWDQLLRVTPDLTDDERVEAHRLFATKVRQA